MAFNRVKRDLEYQDPPEILLQNQHICKNKNPIGQSVFELQVSENLFLFAQLPSRYHNKILFGRGDICLATFPVNYLTEKPTDVMGTIDMLFTKENILSLKQQGRFPDCFAEDDTTSEEEELDILDFESSDDYY